MISKRVFASSPFAVGWKPDGGREVPATAKLYSAIIVARAAASGRAITNNQQTAKIKYLSDILFVRVCSIE